MPDRDQAALLSLRPAQAADGDFLFELYRDSLAEEFTSLPLGGAQLDFLVRMQFQARETGYSATFPNAADRIIVRGGKRIGRLLVAADEREVRILDVAVLSTERSAGAGGFAIREVLCEAAVAARPLRLSVLKSNLRAAGLYRRLGFRETSGTEPYLEMEWTGQCP
jgi:ribosomal protein S18 acetylase RimI-like enzyme